MNSLENNQLWCPGQSLWILITEYVSESELLKIRAALGHSLVDMYTEVHAEAVMWHKLWWGRQHCGNQNSRAKSPFTCPRGSPLPDPPVVKELVRAEVKMLLQTLKENTCKSGRDEEELLFGYKLETVNYALGYQETRYSNSVNFENTDDASRLNSSCSVQSSAEDELETIKDKLNVSEIHKVITWLRTVFLSESEALSTLIKRIKGNVKQNHQRDQYLTEPSLTELRELRAAIQMDLNLLPSSLEASSPPPVKGVKKNSRKSAGQMSDSALPSSPTLNLRPDLTSPCRLKPKPPSPHPPTKTSLLRTHGLHRITSASNKPSKPAPSNRMNTTAQDDVKSSESKTLCSFPTRQGHLSVHHRSCLNVHTENSERDSPSPEHRLSSQSCVPLQHTDLSPHRERKNSSARASRDINITSSSAPALSHVTDAGSHCCVDTSHSVSEKAQDGQQESSTGSSSESTVVQLDNRGRISSSRSSVLSETPAQSGRKKLESLVHRNKLGHLRLNTNKQQGPNSSRLTSAASHPGSGGAPRRDTCSQPQSAETTGKYVVSPKNAQGKPTNLPRSDQLTQTKPQLPKMFHQPVPSAGAQT